MGTGNVQGSGSVWGLVSGIMTEDTVTGIVEYSKCCTEGPVTPAARLLLMIAAVAPLTFRNVSAVVLRGIGSDFYFSNNLVHVLEVRTLRFMFTLARVRVLLYLGFLRIEHK